MTTKTIGARLRLGVAATAMSAMFAVTAAPAYAGPVRNPGAITLTSNGGYISINGTSFNIDKPDQNQRIVLTGSVDANGNITIPNSGVRFPPISYTVGGIITATISIEAITPATGSVDPVTGAADLNFSVRVRLQHTLLPSNCRLDPIAMTVTTGTSGRLTGTPYDQTNGSATLVSNTFAVPGATDCTAWWTPDYNSLINNNLGLPTAAGNNELVAAFNVSPIVTAP